MIKKFSFSYRNYLTFPLPISRIGPKWTLQASRGIDIAYEQYAELPKQKQKYKLNKNGEMQVYLEMNYKMGWY